MRAGRRPRRPGRHELGDARPLHWRCRRGVEGDGSERRRGPWNSSRGAACSATGARHGATWDPTPACADPCASVTTSSTLLAPAFTSSAAVARRARAGATTDAAAAARRSRSRHRAAARPTPDRHAAQGRARVSRARRGAARSLVGADALFAGGPTTLRHPGAPARAGALSRPAPAHDRQRAAAPGRELRIDGALAGRLVRGGSGRRAPRQRGRARASFDRRRLVELELPSAAAPRTSARAGLGRRSAVGHLSRSAAHSVTSATARRGVAAGRASPATCGATRRRCDASPEGAAGRAASAAAAAGACGARRAPASRSGPVDVTRPASTFVFQRGGRLAAHAGLAGVRDPRARRWRRRSGAGGGRRSTRWRPTAPSSRRRRRVATCERSLRRPARRALSVSGSEEAERRGASARRAGAGPKPAELGRTRRPSQVDAAHDAATADGVRDARGRAS